MKFSQKKSNLKENKFKCSTCEVTFKSKKVLEVHMKEKHERTYTCNICNFIAKSVTSIEKHKEEAHSTQHNCMKCKRTFLNENILANHIKTHERSARLEEFNCNSCDFPNTKRKALKDHLEAAPGHKPSQKDYECRNCKKNI